MNRAAHPDQEFLGVPPGHKHKKKLGENCKLNFYFSKYKYKK